MKEDVPSIPVYHMANERIPKKWINKMMSLMAKFFWGKLEKTRYMTFVSWNRVCRPLEQGGLGVRNLSLFAEALLLKIAWSMMSEQDKIWVHTCRAKYYPRIGFWGASVGSRASPLWRQVTNMKFFFKEDVKWQINDGKKIGALSQPWYDGWGISSLANRADRQLKVGDLYDPDTQQWKIEELERLFGQQGMHTIVSQSSKPDQSNIISDRLLWLKTKSGNYSVKQGYMQLANENGLVQGASEGTQWQEMWKWRGIQPKVKIFVWRLLLKALPLAQNMHNRIQGFSPKCQRCQLENEYESHCMFFCPGSQVAWFGGQLGLRTHGLSLDIGRAFQQVTSELDERGRIYFCHMLWEIWKSRNREVLQGEKMNPREIWQRVNYSLVSQSMDEIAIQEGQQRREDQIIVTQGSLLVTVDASCDAQGRTGTAHVRYRRGSLCSMSFSYHSDMDPFWAEATALLEAMQHVREIRREEEDGGIAIFSDCLNLIKVIDELDIDEIPSWRAINTVAQVMQISNQMREVMTIKHARREAVHPAHVLANHARRFRASYKGPPSHQIRQNMAIEGAVDSRFFLQLQDDPP